MKIKHTPGPWYIENNEVMGDAVVSKSKIIGFNKGNRDWKANARLIAAAPEAVAACRDLIAWAKEQPADQLASLSKFELALDSAIEVVRKVDGKA